MHPYIDVNELRSELASTELTPERRSALQQEIAQWAPAARAELDAALRRLPAEQTVDIRDLVYR
jgi:hypothetical protein